MSLAATLSTRFSLEPIHLFRLPINPRELFRDPTRHRLPVIKHLPLRQRSARRINSGKIDQPAAQATVVGTLRLIEAVRDHMLHGGRPVRFYQAGSSEMFGAAPHPQNERTPFYPRSPYGVSKMAAH